MAVSLPLSKLQLCTSACRLPIGESLHHGRHWKAPVDSDSRPEKVTNSIVTSLGSESAEDFEATRQRLLAQQDLVKSGPPVLPTTALFRRKGPQPDLDQVATQPSVYDDPKIAKYFQPTPKYENLHRFDPSARWTWREELPLINRFDSSWSNFQESYVGTMILIANSYRFPRRPLALSPCWGWHMPAGAGTSGPTWVSLHSCGCFQMTLPS